MAVIAYASGNSSPILNPGVDPEIDLSTVVLPQTVNLYGDAFDSSDPLNTGWNWTWTIVGEDPANPGALSSAVVQNPTVDVSSWHNVRLFLIVQNTTTLEYSEQDPQLAPDSAFVAVRVLSDATGIQKPAPGERNYHEALHDVIEAVDTGATSTAAHAINDHTDATASVTGANLNTLTSGANATGLHTHNGTDVGLATAAARGSVVLEETGAGSAKVITRERVHLQATVDASRTSAHGLMAGAIVPESYPSDQSVASGKPLAVWRADEALTIKDWAVTLVDGGPSAPSHAYKFRLGVATAASAGAGVWSDLGSELTGNPSNDQGVMALNGALASDYVLAAGSYIAVFCLAAPRTTDGDQPGGGMTAQIFARREVV